MTTDMQAILQDAIEAITESADEIKAGCAIGEHWPDAEDKAEYDRRIALLERLRALASRPDAQADELKRLREIARLIGSIFVHGNFKAETYNERALEKLLREQGCFFESLADYDAARAAAPQAEAAQGVPEGEYKHMFEDAIRSLAAIDEALGIDPDEAGGAAPILEAIEGLQDALKLARETFFMNRIDVPRVFEKIDEALAAAPSRDREQTPEGCTPADDADRDPFEGSDLEGGAPEQHDEEPEDA